MNKHESQLVIRKAGKADARLLADIGMQAFRDAFGPQNDPEDMAAYLKLSFSVGIQAKEIAEPGSTFLIVERGQVPVGYARLYDCLPPDCVKSGHPLELVRFYILQPWIGQGLGSLLMQQCIDFAQAQGYDAIWLSVWTKNPRAIAFYRRWEFEVAGTAHFQLGRDRQLDYIMVRSLSSSANEHR